MNYFIIGVLVYCYFAISFSFDGLNSEEYDSNTIEHYQNMVRSKRVVSNETELAHSKPWMVFLDTAEGLCGGFLMDPHLYVSSTLQPPENTSDIVVTAAHCVTKRNHSIAWAIDPSLIIARFGVHNPYIEENWVESITAKYISVHDSYNPGIFSHDIAIIRLSKAVKFSKLVQPLNITSLNVTNVSNCSISGWGADPKKPDGVDGNGVLATVNLLDSPRFVSMEWASVFVHLKDGATTIGGDSGSPVVCKKDGKVFAQGIHSGSNGEYKRYANLFQMRSWLLSSMEKIYSMVMHHPKLYDYVRFGAVNHELVWSKLNDLLWNLYGHVPRELQVEIESEVVDYHRVWTDYKLEERVSLDHNVFNSMNIVGYSEEEDVFHCVSACFIGNSLGGCNYVPVLKRCYYLRNTEPCGNRGKCIRLGDYETVHIYYNKVLKELPHSQKKRQHNRYDVYVSYDHEEGYICPATIKNNYQNDTVYDVATINERCLHNLIHPYLYWMWRVKPKFRFGVYLSNMQNTMEQSLELVNGYMNYDNNLYLMTVRNSPALNKQIRPISLSHEKIEIGSNSELLAYGWNVICPHMKTLHEIPMLFVETTSEGIIRVKPQADYAFECNGENDNAGRPLVHCVSGKENCVLYGISTNVIEEHGKLFQNVTVISDSMSWLQEKTKS